MHIPRRYFTTGFIINFVPQIHSIFARLLPKALGILVVSLPLENGLQDVLVLLVTCVYICTTQRVKLQVLKLQSSAWC